MNAEESVRDSIDHLFRHQAGQMVSVLARKFGVANIDLIEDAVQDAMIAAMKNWPYSGVPENRSAWLIQVAKNRVIDRLRRENRSDSIDDGSLEAEDGREHAARFAGELNEDQIRMIFACCHSVIPPDSQVALTLKIVCGFSVGEIARAYLAKDEAIAKMLTRAKQKLRTVELEIPAQKELSTRFDSVLRVLYLMFNEGYSASEGIELIRRDLCFEAIRLAGILIDHPLTSVPKVHALMALFLFQAARLSTRTDSQGDLLLLADQERSKWDRRLLDLGLEHFSRSAAGDEFTDYHIEAEIASIHALAPEFESTNWSRILECYDLLQQRRFSPIVGLNRIVAVGNLHGAETALNELKLLGENYMMTSFNLFHITHAHFLSEAGKLDEAIAAYQRAVKLTRNDSVIRFIGRKIEMLNSSE
jgi:RNA polymerase sigma factor (sigma-70 family)